MDTQPFVSVICEYNPFHYGHEYQIQQLKKEFDKVVCIMSGNVVQRGTFAVSDKYIRATAALNCGADLVLELPLPYCCASASDFARAGVFIAEAIGSDYLAFGAEDDIETLMKIRETASKKEFSEAVSRIIAENKNISYPNAFSSAISEFLGEEYAKR
ncbi:MAG: nucleotidyltransferase family protein [Clostridia bacterium]|nr:nucleotidyltransferase family protein [Clostridia bacterium]